eukprot:snap_masked-scaffold_23-processed-gene-2.23-mRNA-1 protein AED:1.00 eAED:1.00 QI:0/0/0/0/1/1/2/0/104
MVTFSKQVGYGESFDNIHYIVHQLCFGYDEIFFWFGTQVTFWRSRDILLLSTRGTYPVMILNCVVFKALVMEKFFLSLEFLRMFLLFATCIVASESNRDLGHFF